MNLPQIPVPTPARQPASRAGVAGRVVTRQVVTHTARAAAVVADLADRAADRHFQRRQMRPLPSWADLAAGDEVVMASVAENLERCLATETRPDPATLADRYAFTVALAMHRHREEVRADLAAGRTPAALTWDELSVGAADRYVIAARNWLLTLPQEPSRERRTA